MLLLVLSSVFARASNPNPSGSIGGDTAANAILYCFDMRRMQATSPAFLHVCCAPSRYE